MSAFCVDASAQTGAEAAVVMQEIDFLVAILASCGSSSRPVSAVVFSSGMFSRRL